MTRYLKPSHIFLKPIVLISLLRMYHESILLSLSTTVTVGHVIEGFSFFVLGTRGRGLRFWGRNRRQNLFACCDEPDVSLALRDETDVSFVTLQ